MMAEALLLLVAVVLYASFAMAGPAVRPGHKMIYLSTEGDNAARCLDGSADAFYVVPRTPSTSASSCTAAAGAATKRAAYRARGRRLAGV